MTPRVLEDVNIHRAQAPSSWVLANLDLLPRAGRVLDVACGGGRHALLLASRGFGVDAVDRDTGVIERLRASAARLGLAVRAEVRDLEAGDLDLGREAYDGIVVVHYLHRPLFPVLVAALKPGGVLLYETFTRRQADRGMPTNPEFLLDEGELPGLVTPLEVLRAREGEFEKRLVSAVAARKLT